MCVFVFVLLLIIYMAFNSLIQEFHFGIADMENKEERERKKKRGKYTVFHMISVVSPSPGLASSYFFFNGDG